MVAVVAVVHTRSLCYLRFSHSRWQPRVGDWQPQNSSGSVHSAWLFVSAQ